MPTAIGLFANYAITGNIADQPRNTTSQDWIGIGIEVTAVAGAGAQVTFKLQWSFDNNIWGDSNPVDTVGTFTAPGATVARFAVKAPYWRLAATVSGNPSPVFTTSAGAYI